ncbi:uncharacterized protein LOC130810338 isoform X1 [Amaranthus tricolor]|uniref:uncharacterized protein LOC130810338 isoform X1 n=1 Tax=Amaranthus tricolor TaxID=29722 RepID=UPI002590CAFA|nr:uncharacterized protein LOC130810338 isoform X1 [Amaranthus tricolor]
MMLKGFLSFCLVLFCGLLFAVQVYSKKAHGNPTKDIVYLINKNRTAIKLPAVFDSAGLGCIALQYAEACKDNCTSNNTVSCHPLGDDITEVYAPDCGVELPTISTISGKLVGCSSKYLSPSEAFSHVLARDNKSMSILENITHTEMGVGVASNHKGHLFWCVLFSDGLTNSSFILEDHGQGIKQKMGCFSGTNTTCSEATSIKSGIYIEILLCIFSLIFLLLI